MNLPRVVVLWLMLLISVSPVHRSTCDVDETHLHIEKVTVISNAPASRASGSGGTNGTAKPKGLAMTASVGTPISIAF